MNKFNKIHVFLRQTAHNKVSQMRPEWFDYERCFVSLLESFNFSFAELNIIFDGNQEEYNNHFTKKYDGLYKFKVKLIDTKTYIDKTYENDGSSKSYSLVSKYIKELNLSPDSLIFILENDYIFLPFDWVNVVLDLYNNYTDENVYVSLYDHADKYLFRQSIETMCNHNLDGCWGMYRDLKSEIIISNWCHWRTVSSICSSWIMSARVFNRDFKYHSIGISDNTLCDKVFREHETKFLSPLPSINTHSEKTFLAPFVNWKGVLDKVNKL